MPPASERAREDNPAIALPAGFDQWLFGCIDRDPSRRFASAGAAAQALAALTRSVGAARAKAVRESSMAAAPMSTLRVPAEDMARPPGVTASSVPSLTTAVSEHAAHTRASPTARRAWLVAGLGAVLALLVAGAWLALGQPDRATVAPVTASPAWTGAGNSGLPAPGARSLELPASSPVPAPTTTSVTDGVDAAGASQRVTSDLAPAVMPSSAAIDAPPARTSATPRAGGVSRSRGPSAPPPGRAPTRVPSTPASKTPPTFVELPP